jgi:hypothetical protein
MASPIKSFGNTLSVVELNVETMRALRNVEWAWGEVSSPTWSAYALKLTNA